MRFLFALVVLALAGCLKPDPTGPGQEDPKSGIEDKKLLAGATSSTNWPQEDAGSEYPYLKGSAAILPSFQIFDTNDVRMKVSGKTTLYKAGTIPAIDKPESVSFQISNLDSFNIPESKILALKEPGEDTIAFSVMFESNSNQAFITGFLYSVGLKKILTSPFSAIPNLSINLVHPHYFLHGVPDSLLTNVKLYPEGKVEWCFYIPGSPYFFKVSPDTAISIGPIPNGNYPIRLLRFSKNDGRTSQLEVYEVKSVLGPIDATHHDIYQVIQVGAKLFEIDTETSISIRSDSL